jgi:hypothetical protein
LKITRFSNEPNWQVETIQHEPPYEFRRTEKGRSPLTLAAYTCHMLQSTNRPHSAVNTGVTCDSCRQITRDVFDVATATQYDRQLKYELNRLAKYVRNTNMYLFVWKNLHLYWYQTFEKFSVGVWPTFSFAANSYTGPEVVSAGN